MRKNLLPVTVLFFTLFLTLACNEKDESSSKPETTDTTTEQITPTPPVENEKPSTTKADTPGLAIQEQEAGTNANLPPAGKDSRIAYINSAVILNEMPEVNQADRQLQQFAEGLDKELKRQQQLFQQKYSQYMQDTSVSQAIVQTRTQEMQQMQQRIMKLQQDSEQELASRKEKLYAPILNKVDRAIKKVAKDKGYTHVLDITGGSLVYAEESTNITPLVQAELGL